MITEKRYFLVAILLIQNFLSPLGCFGSPFFFTYTESELSTLSTLNSQEKMTFDQILSWDLSTKEYLNKISSHEEPSLIYSYLYVAQYEAAQLSYQLKQQFVGSLDLLSAEVLKLFFPQIDLKPFRKGHDFYSLVLTDLIISKIKQRMVEDRSGRHLYPQKKGEGYWIGKIPFQGQSMGSWKPWFLSSGSQYRLPSPPAPWSSKWEKQLALVKDALAHLNEEKRDAVLYWAGIGQKKGDWIEIGNQLIQEQKATFTEALCVRAFLATSLSDALIACYDSKYTYWVQRPNMMDPTIKPIIPVPNHPSYPSGHSTVSTTAADILSYFFPDKKEECEKLAKQASNSRIWAGIHFPLDQEMGIDLGHKVGELGIKIMNENAIWRSP